MPKNGKNIYKVAILSWEVWITKGKDIRETPNTWVTLFECTTIDDFEKVMLEIQHIQEITALKYIVITPEQKQYSLWEHYKVHKILAHNEKAVSVKVYESKKLQQEGKKDGTKGKILGTYDNLIDLNSAVFEKANHTKYLSYHSEKGKYIPNLSAAQRYLAKP